MKLAKLGTLEHYCTEPERTCKGIVLSVAGGVRKIHKVTLTLPGKRIPRGFGDEAEARKWAARHGYEVE